MDRELVSVNFICPVCQKRALAQHVLAEDGFIYHEGCIKKYIDPERMVLKSPMTGKELGSRLIFSNAIKSTLEDLEKCERGFTNVNNEADKKISETVVNANTKDLASMPTLGRWYLFGEQRCTEKDVARGSELVNRAAEGNSEAKAFRGHCLIHGPGVEKNKNEGFQLLVEAASEDRSVGRDFAAYTLGFCYREGLQGFKCDNKRDTKWLKKVIHKPDDIVTWGYEYDGDLDDCLSPQDTVHVGCPSTAQVKQHCADDSHDGVHRESTGQEKLFSEHASLSSATTISTDENSIKQFYLNFASISEKTLKNCVVCSGIFERKDIMGTRCHYCASKDFNRLWGLDES